MREIIYLLKLVVFVTGASVFSNHLYAQVVFQKHLGIFNGCIGYSVLQTYDLGYMIAGQNYHSGIFIKTDVNGDTIWTKSIQFNHSSAVRSISQTSDHGYIALAEAEDAFGELDAYLVKLDSIGNTIWSRFYIAGGSCLNVTEVNTNGYAFICGTVTIAGDISCIFRTDSNGDTLWTTCLDGFRGYKIIHTTDNEFIVSGTQGNVAGCIIKLDSTGVVLWSKTYQGNEGLDVEQTSDGGYVMIDNINVGNQDIYVIKTDSSGNVSWVKLLGGPAYDIGNSIHQTKDGGFILAGYSTSFNTPNNADAYLVKLDTIGNPVWSKTYGQFLAGGLLFDLFNSVTETIDSGFVLTGLTSGNIQDIYFIKTDSLGNTGCLENTVTTLAVTFPVTIGNFSSNIAQSFITFSSQNVTASPYSPAITTLCSNVNVSLPPQITNELLKIAPNPFNSTITLQNTDLNGDVKLFDSCGKKILEQPVNGGTIVIHTQMLEEGMYFLLFENDFETFVQKVIKLGDRK